MIKTNYNVVYSSKFNKNLKKVRKQGKDIEKLLDIIDLLVLRKPIDPKYRDHALNDSKRYQGCRDIHIEPDWVLIYKYKDKDLILLLVNTGSHSDVLDK